MKDIKLNERDLEKVMGGLELTISEIDPSKLGNLAPPSDADIKIRKENMDRMIAGLKASCK